VNRTQPGRIGTQVLHPTVSAEIQSGARRAFYTNRTHHAQLVERQPLQPCIQAVGAGVEMLDKDAFQHGGRAVLEALKRGDLFAQTSSIVQCRQA
jgi:hypothetical protein